jgi:adenine-specific DNA-methyltransferase
MINSFDELFKLFHKVLAVNLKERTEAIKGKYSKVPYLNSSLFEISELEDQAIRINSLDNEGQLGLINTTILKETKKKAASLPSLDYLFKFLDAYDFASEGTEDVQEDNKTIINSSVLGKVFEKINGYKDGSIFTPGFITMNMCRKAIRLAVIQKFKDKYGWNIEHFDDIKNYLADRKSTKDILEFNELINSLRLCDPAVGSGHYLVSSLNEIIVIKYELGLLADNTGNRIRDYEITIVNDELIITDLNDNIFEYKLLNGKPINKEIQRLQKTLFHEKQTIIENCLFGVDINPNSVKICRLRLWIELLKNAYYKEETNFLELETLPNIDINIKCGNSLLSRFSLDSDLSKALKSIKYDIKAYRGFVSDYKNEKSREVKRGLQQIIDRIKTDFRAEILNNDPKVIRLSKLSGDLYNLLNQTKLFDEDTKLKKARKEKQQKLEADINKLAKEIEAIKTNAIYKNAFEWCFEFPEVLNNKGEFEGFDLIIGNPPYIKEYDNRDAFNGLRNLECYQGKMDIWYLFGDLGLKLLKPNCNLCYIATNNWVTNAGASNFRNIVINKSQIVNLTDFGAYMIFENASIQTMIMLFKNTNESDNYTFDYRRLEGDKPSLESVYNLLNGVETATSALLLPTVNKASLVNKSLTFNTDENAELLNKIKAKHNFTIDPKKEIAQGIVPNPDVVNKTNILKLPSARVTKENIKVGDGVFIVNRGMFNKLSVKENKYIKPIYEPYLIDKYSLNDYDKEIIYITKKNFKNDAPKLIAHLEKFKEIMDDRRENQKGTLGFNHLHWPRDNYFFEEGAKILSVRKCSVPTFAYTEVEAYVMMSFNVFRSKRINLKYLTGLLNSKLIAFWLRKKGKMQGNAYQLDKEPLLDIPIYKPTDSEANKIATLVDKIIAQKEQGKNSKENETKIDELVYKLYDLTTEEQKIIEDK